MCPPVPWRSASPLSATSRGGSRRTDRGPARRRSRRRLGPHRRRTMARKKKTVDLDRENDIAPGLVAKTKKRLVVAGGRSHPALSAEVAAVLGHRARAHRVPHLRVRRDPHPLRGVDPRLRLLPHPELRPAGQRVAHGDAHHAGCRQARIREADHRRRAVLPLLAPGQEEPRPRADQRPAGRRTCSRPPAPTAS